MDTAATLLLLVVAVATILLLRRRQSHARLPPGPRGIPLLGSLPFLDPDLHRYFSDLARAYGPILSLRLGTRLHVVVSSSGLADEVLRTHDAIFANHPAPATAIALHGGEDILWAPLGPYWRMIRKVAVRDLLSPSVVDSLIPVRRRVVRRKLVEIPDGAAMSIREWTSGVSLGVVLGMIRDSGKEEEEEKEESAARELPELVDALVGLYGAPNISDFFPAVAALDLQGLQRRMRRLKVRLWAILDSIVEQRRRSSGDGGGGEEAKDFLQLLLDLIDREDPETPFQLDHAKALLLDLIAAGIDTTSTTIEWAMTELLLHPEVMARAVSELDAVVGSGGVLEEAEIPKLPYLNAAVKETMRLHPPLPLLVPHTPSEDCEVGGYTVPRGASVFVNVWAIHRDPSAWAEPLEFRPERFLEKRRDHGGIGCEYLPFGGGRRICAGIGLSERVVGYVLGSLLHSFRWRAPAGAAMGVDDKFGLVLKKKEPLVLVPSRRQIKV